MTNRGLSQRNIKAENQSSFIKNMTKGVILENAQNHPSKDSEIYARGFVLRTLLKCYPSLADVGHDLCEEISERRKRKIDFSTISTPVKYHTFGFMH